MKDSLKVYDNGGKTFDRYTVLRTDWREKNGCCMSFGMSEHPFHPQGFGQHGAAQDGPHLGSEISWDDLSSECQEAAKHFLED